MYQLLRRDLLLGELAMHGLICFRKKQEPIEMDDIQLYSGWWFGTWLLFSIIYGIILPIDFHIFQDG